jgi:hypothetical protein
MRFMTRHALPVGFALFSILVAILLIVPHMHPLGGVGLAILPLMMPAAAGKGGGAAGSTGRTMTPAQANMMARQSLIKTGLPFTKRLQSYSSIGSAAILGATIRVPLDRTGVVTGVTLFFTVPYTANATGYGLAIGTYISQFFPYNIVQNITYTDFAGVKHVNTTGFQLHALNMLRGGKIINNAHTMEGYITSETGLNANILGIQNAATGAAVLKGSDFPEYGNIIFSLYVPLAYDAGSDLRGAVLAQTDRGEHYLNITFANALAPTTGDPLTTPIAVGATGGTFTLGNAGQTYGQAYIEVDAFQHYLMPQQGVSPQNLPMIDLGTIYEIMGGLTDSSNIVAGNNKFVNWPNNRAIVSAMHIYDNPTSTTGVGNALNEIDMTLVTLLINGNTNVRQLTPQLMRMWQRYALGVDLPSGVYYLPARKQPITTQLYGNVQTQFTLETVNTEAAIGTPYFMNQFESFYLSGTPLPGVIQG